MRSLVSVVILVVGLTAGCGDCSKGVEQQTVPDAGVSEAQPQQVTSETTENAELVVSPTVDTTTVTPQPTPATDTPTAE